jgi:hypothetical protein
MAKDMSGTGISGTFTTVLKPNGTLRHICMERYSTGIQYVVEEPDWSTIKK